MHACFRFYAELNDHLPAEQQFQTLEKQFVVPSTVKDMLESFGVPHAEVEFILANGTPVDFSYLVQDGDRIAVYPVFESLDITPELRVRREPLREPKFVLDVHLGKLAAVLRMLGFDSVYCSSASDAELVRISCKERRILLTRDRGLLKHNAVTHGYWIRETGSRHQAVEVIARFDLKRRVRPFTRCMACNRLLDPVDRMNVKERVPEGVWQRFSEFWQCHGCGRVYWRGSHYQRMLRKIEELTSS
jgi:uncharacterized protein with PIN domain